MIYSLSNKNPIWKFHCFETIFLTCAWPLGNYIHLFTVVSVIALQRYWRVNKAEYYFSQTNCRIIKMAPESTWNNATGYCQTLFSGIYHRRIIEGPLTPFRAKLCYWFCSALTGRHRNKLPAEEAWRHIEVNN